MVPKHWGSGQRAAADGTKWDVYKHNLLSEYHIRYGGWGGIGYYHVADTYISLFSSFIACGVWEAIHILDGRLENRSEICPDTLHAGTQGQSEPVFGLAYLLAIQLLPRIRKRYGAPGISPMTASARRMRSQDLSGTAWKAAMSCVPCLSRRCAVLSSGRCRKKKTPVAGGSAYPSSGGHQPWRKNRLARPRTGSIRL